MVEPHILPASRPPFGANPLADAGADMQQSEQVWIDVVRQMDSVYADLVASQTTLEEQHRELAEAHDLIGSVLEGMTDIVIACGPDGSIERVNGALLTIVGGEQSALLQRQIVGLFAPDEQQSVRDAMMAVRGGDPVEQREWHLIASDGARATVSTTIAPRRDGQGKFAGLVFVGRPLGELQRAYRELDDAHRRITRTQEQLLVSEKMAALGRLVAGVAHELNNPISFVFGNMYSLKRYGAAITRYLEATKDRPREPALEALRQDLRIDRILSDIGPLVDGTLEGAERVRDIVQDLRRFSSNQAEEPEAFNLIRLIHTAADWVAKAQRIKPQFSFAMPDRLEVVSRKGQLHQILVNLIQNGCDAVAGQADGHVRIDVMQDGEQISITVADNGPGIPVQNRAKIFEPFFTTKPIGSGTGLGLYISYNLATKLSGHLDYADAVGGGARFTLRLPVEGKEQVE